MAEVSEEKIRDIAETWFEDRRSRTDDVVADLRAHLRRHLKPEAEDLGPGAGESVENTIARAIWNANEAGLYGEIRIQALRAIEHGRSLSEPVDVEALADLVLSKVKTGDEDFVLDAIIEHCEGRTKAQPEPKEETVDAEYPWVVAEHSDVPGNRGIGFIGSDDGPPEGDHDASDNLIYALDHALGGDYWRRP